MEFSTYRSLLEFSFLKIHFFFFRFLGYFQPREGKPALWELDSDYYLHVSGIGDDLIPDYGYFVANLFLVKYLEQMLSI